MDFQFDFLQYSQTWANDHLRITTTCLKRPSFWGPISTFYQIKIYFWTTTSCQQRTQIRGPRVVVEHGFDCSCIFRMIILLNGKNFCTMIITFTNQLEFFFGQNEHMNLLIVYLQYRRPSIFVFLNILGLKTWITRENCFFQRTQNQLFWYSRLEIYQERNRRE